MIVDAYPLSALQAGMLYHAEYREHTAAFHDVLTLTLDGPIDLAALRAALAELVARHPVLRTSFDLTRFSEPVQLVHDSATVPVEELDGSVDRWREAEQFRSYDLDTAPLLRATIHGSALSLSFHHAILDGWSVASLVTELVRRYAAHLTGNPLPVTGLGDTFRDFVAAERRTVADRDVSAFWTETVAEAPVTRLPALPGYPVGDALVSRRHVIEFDESLRERLTATAAALKVPLRALLLAAHLRVLSLVTGEPEVITGMVTHGRPETESGADVCGLFLNTVPVRLRVDHTTWRELVSEVDERITALLPHRRFPLFEIQRLARRSPLVETAFDFHDFHVYDALPAGGPVRIVRQDHVETTDIPFTAIFASDRGESGLTLSYHRTRFPADQIRAIGDYYLAVLREITEDPDRDPRRSGRLLGADLTAIGTWNGTGVEAPEPETLHGRVAHWAVVTPDAVAVVDGNDTLTFAELWPRVIGLAETLTVEPEEVVAVGIPRSVDAVVAILAVLQAGGTVLPLDLDHPTLRLRELIADTGARVLLTTPGIADRFPGMNLTLLHLTRLGSSERLSRVASPDERAAVLFTSGSTGRPKGVMLTHGGVTQFCAWHGRHIGLTGADRVAQRSPLSVDGTFIELAMAYGVGAALVVVPTEAVIDPDTCTEVFTRHGVTATYLVPSLLASLVDALGKCPSLKHVISGGETLPRAVVEAFGKQTTARLHNIYGPTELGCAASQWPTDPGNPDTVVPIGRPGPGSELHVLDASGESLPIGTAGEVYAGGPQIARGYAGSPGTTADRFVPDHVSGRPGRRLYRTGDRARWLPSGQLEFAGRRDNQVKINGIRTELGEIEVRLSEHPNVLQAIVTAGQVLTAYVVWSGDSEDAADSLRTFAAERLPAGLVPGRYVFLDEIPVLPNGKADRSALPADDAPAQRLRPPRDLVESRLEALWEEILEVPAVGIGDDFFALGGHSLRALRLIMRLRKEFDRELPVETLMSHPTIEKLAKLLRSPEQLAPSVPVVPFRSKGSRTPIWFVHALGGQVFRYRKLAMLLDDQPVYGIPARGFASGEQPTPTLDAMVEDYARRIRETTDGPVVLGGFCVGGNLAVEVARRLRSVGADVPLVTVFWSQAIDSVSPKFADDTRLMLSALSGADVDLDLERLAGLPADERLTAIMDGAAAAGALDPAVTDLEQAKRMLGVYRANASALRGFRHPAYDGDLALFKPVADPENPLGAAHGWDEVVTGKLDVVPAPGSRSDMAEEPHVRGAAIALREVLDRVNRSH